MTSYDAVLANDFDTLKKLYHLGEHQYNHQLKMCIQATKCNNLEMLTFLFEIDNNFDSSILLFTACTHGSVECFDFIISQLNNKSHFYLDNELIRYAAYNGHLHLLKRLHKLGLSLEGTSLTIICSNKHFDVAEYILENGGKWSMRAMHVFSKENNYEALEFGIKHNALTECKRWIDQLIIGDASIDFEIHIVLRDYLIQNVSVIPESNLLSQIKEEIYYSNKKKEYTEEYCCKYIGNDVLTHIMYSYF